MYYFENFVFNSKMRKLILAILLLSIFQASSALDAKTTKIWGPGLKPAEITLPARYFFIRITNYTGETPFAVKISGESTNGAACRVYMNVLDRKDGTYIIRYKLYEPCNSLRIDVTQDNIHLGNSPYIIKGKIYLEHCNCPKSNFNSWLQNFECPEVPTQIKDDLQRHQSVNWTVLRDKVIRKYDNPGAISLCHYVLKYNGVYRKCYGKYVGFKMFMDSILLSLARKVLLPDVEFFVNLGDWPLVKNKEELYPVFSWCGSRDSYDIVMPTYDITESSLENMGRVMLDMLSVQGNVELPWKERIPKGFWRGRDSNRERLQLVALSKANPEVLNVSLTNFFFFRDEEHIYGPRSEHVSFFKFFDYKYQLNLDGTVAAYRFPYLLAGGSLVFKQDSGYYEHFYNELSSYIHYVPVKRDLSDLLEKINWALANDEEAEKIAKQGQEFAFRNLLPKDIICYYALLLDEFSKKVVSPVEILEDMEKVEQPENVRTCKCASERNDVFSIDKEEL